MDDRYPRNIRKTSSPHLGGAQGGGRLGPVDGSVVITSTVKMGSSGLTFGTDEPVLSARAAIVAKSPEKA